MVVGSITIPLHKAAAALAWDDVTGEPNWEVTGADPESIRRALGVVLNGDFRPESESPAEGVFGRKAVAAAAAFFNGEPTFPPDPTPKGTGGTDGAEGPAAQQRAFAEWLTKCGGPGSGVPGPCPSGHADDPKPAGDVPAHGTEPGKPFMPAAPMADRLAAYKHGDELVARIIAETDPKVRVDKLTETAAAASAASDKWMAAYKDHEAAKAGGDKDKIAAAFDRLRAASKESEAAQSAHAEANENMKDGLGADRHEMLKALAVKEPVEIDARTGSGLTQGQKADADWVAGDLAAITAHGGTPKLAVLIKALPHDDPDYFPYFERGETQAKDEIRLTRTAGDTTQAHEYGHLFEARLPGVKAAAQEFLDHRMGKAGAGKDAEVKLAEKFPARGLLADETGREDSFGRFFGEGSLNSFYAGKTYAGGDTEVVAMGVEALYANPGKFCRTDPEYAKFVIGVLNGHLRK